jgi:hypothetical protein
MRFRAIVLALVLSLTGVCHAQSNMGGGGTTGGSATLLPGNTINVSAAPYNMAGGFQIYDAATTITSPNVTSTGFTFTSSMIGWLAHMTNCAGTPCVGSGYLFPLNGGAENTIIGCSPSCPSHIAVLSQNANASVAAGSGIFTFGPNNDAGWTALEAALNSYSTVPNCPVVIMGGGYYFTRKGRFNTVTCLNPAWNAPFTGSNLDKLLTVSGLGEPTNTYIELTQDFDFTSGLGNSCGGGVSNNTCFGGAQATKFMNIGIDGGGASLSGGNHAVNLLEVTNDSYMYQVYCTNIGASDAAMVGLKGSGGAQFSAFLQFVGCAFNPLLIAGAVDISNSFFGGTTGTVLKVNSGALFSSLYNGIGYISTCPANVVQWDISGTMTDTQSATGTCGAVNNTGIKVETGGSFSGNRTTASVAGTASSAAILINNGTATCAGCTLSSAGGGINACGGTTGLFISGGANGITGTTNSMGAAGTCGSVILTPTDVFGGGPFSTPISCTFTSGGGTTPSCAMGAGLNTAERGVIIATTGTGSPGSAGTVTLNLGQRSYSITGAAPVCTFNIDNSGTAWGNEAGVQVSAQSTTAPVVAWFNVNSVVATALTVSSPYRIDYQCVAR